ncbi:flagellar export protein FliJ [bacterium]|nr:MAG: flagellar export protein FliJ [bacterium]
MKKFKFRLQRILDVRTVQEKVKFTLLGQERMKLEDEKYKLDLFEKESDSQIEQIRSEKQQPFTAWSQQANTGYLKRLDRVIEYQKSAVSNQEEAVTNARGSYVKAHRDTESLEIMHEKKLNDWKAETIREEGHALDEHGMRTHSSGDNR